MYLMDLSFAFTNDSDHVIFLNSAIEGTELKISHYKGGKIDEEKTVFRMTLTNEEIDDLIDMLQISKGYNNQQSLK